MSLTFNLTMHLHVTLYFTLSLSLLFLKYWQFSNNLFSSNWSLNCSVYNSSFRITTKNTSMFSSHVQINLPVYNTNTINDLVCNNDWFTHNKTMFISSCSITEFIETEETSFLLKINSKRFPCFELGCPFGKHILLYRQLITLVSNPLHSMELQI